MTVISAADLDRRDLPTRQRVGVMGGMFDPVHLGHLDVARQLRTLLLLDLVLLVPCGSPVHRGPARASGEQRCQMLELAVSNEPWLQVDRRECASPDPSWTHATLSALRRERLDDALYLIMGADAFLGLTTWRHWQELPTLAHIVVCARPGFSLDHVEMNEALERFCRQHRVNDPARLQESLAGGLYLAHLTTPALSSTEVRRRINQRESLDDALPAAVSDYVARQHLYQ